MSARCKQVYLIADDVSRSRAFYEGALGLPLKFADGERWVQFDGGGSSFALASKDEGAAGATGTVVVFEVDDIAALASVIEGAGAMILGERDMGNHGKTLTFRDPEGQIAQLYQRAGPG